MRPDLLIRGGTVVTMDAERRVIEDGAVAIGGGVITAVGDAARLEREHPGARVLDAPTGLITPGLVDAHNHPIHYLSKGLADDLELSRRSYERIWPYEAELTDEEAYVGSLGTFAEMIRSGTTCFCDPGGYRPDAVARAALEIGIRGIVARESWDVPDAHAPGAHPETTDEALERGAAVVERWNGAGDGRLRAWLSLVRPAHVTDELCVRTMEQAEALGVGVHGHLTASRTADARTRRVVGEGSAVRRYRELGVLRPSLCLAHLGWIEPEEIEDLVAADVKAVHCPSASMLGGFGVIAHGTFPEMIDAGLTVALGTDAGAISRFMDLVRVMYLAACGHKDARIDPTAMGAHTAFEMATCAGARALLWSDEIGSLEPGKAADLVVFDTDGAEWHPRPLRNPVANLVYSASGHSARTVIIGGAVVMEDRVLTTIDLPELLARTDAAADDVLGRLGLTFGPAWPTARRGG
jgi:5-methylthioadenosine/S-adenosylhomocysteine deaminase